MPDLITDMAIDGQHVPADAHFDVVNPSTGEVLGQAPAASRSQVDQAMESSSRAFKSWRHDEEFRVEKLLEFSRAMVESAADFGSDLAQENGKTVASGTAQAVIGSMWLEYYANLTMPEQVLREDERSRVTMLRKPLGVVGAITPWNMPVTLAFRKMAPALRAGNTVVLKPSPYTPFSTLRFGEIAREILPPGVLNVVTGGNDVGEWITSHPTPRKVSFTGSVTSGKHVAVAAAEDLKRVTLELGGNDPAIVLEDADVAKIAEGLFWTSFTNNGQGCCLVKRVYAHASIHDQLVEALAEVAKKVVVGNPLEAGVELGPLATSFQADRVAELVANALSNGAVAAAGGRRGDGPGYFYEPTILSNLNDGTAIVDEEQFGPALPVVPFSDVDDAIERANATTFGLGASVWTSDLERGEAIARRIDAGSTWINTHAALAPDVPFGGRHWSGIGVENGPWGLDSYTDIQVIHTNYGDVKVGV